MEMSFSGTLVLAGVSSLTLKHCSKLAEVCWAKALGETPLKSAINSKV